MEKATEKVNLKEQEKELDLPEPKQASPTIMLSSGIAVRGAALLPQKLLGILDWYHNNQDPRSGVMSIVAREDGQPKGVVALSFPWSASYVLNLEHLWNRVVAKLEKEPRLNLVAACWFHLIEACLHETVHIGMAFADPKEHAEYLATKTDEDEAAMEEMVKEVAREKLFDLAKVVDIEPPAAADMGWLGGLIMTKFLGEPENEMVVKSQKMLEDGLVYSDLDSDAEDYVYHRTLRSFIKHTLAPEDAEWDDTANLVQVTYTLDTGETETVVAEPVEEAPVVEATPAVGTGQPTFVQPTTDETVVEDTTPDHTLLAQQYETTSNGTVNPSQPVQQPAAVSPVASDVAGGQAAPSGVVDTFQLPNTVVQQQQAAVENLTAPTQPMAPPPLEKLDLSAEAIQGCMREIYMRLYSTMFTRCGWSQNPQTGRFHFASLAENFKAIDIKDILDRWNANGLIVSFLAPNGNNQDTDHECNEGFVCGFKYHKTQIPAFQLTLNIGGHRVVRKLIAQNPNKITNNAYTKGADMAGVGNAMAYIFSEADQSQPWHVRCPAKIVNNDYQIQTG